MTEENDTLKLTSVNYTSDNYLAAKKNEDGSYNVENKVVFEEDITISGSEVATKSDLDGKQDKLTAEASINLDGSTISVNTSPLVGDSDLPVTASAVNTKLGDYATTTDLNNKQDKLDWYRESDDYPYKVDIAANEVTLRAGGDTVGMIGENVRLTLSESNDYSDKTDIKIETFSESSASWLNVLSAGGTIEYGEILSLGDPQMSVYINGPVYDKDGNEITGGGGSSSFNYISENEIWPSSLSLGQGPNGNADAIFVCAPLYSVYLQGPIIDNNTNITLIQGKETWDGSGVHQVVIGDDSHSVYIQGPLYDKDGNEIIGGGGGGSKYIIDDINNDALILGVSANSDYAASIFVSGPLYFRNRTNPADTAPDMRIIDDGNLLINGISYEFQRPSNSVFVMGPVVLWNNNGSGGDIILRIDDTILVLDETKLGKLRDFIETL